MKSAVNKIFYGVILSCAALSINGVPLFNDFIGILIIMAGLNELIGESNEEGYFLKAYKSCKLFLLVIVIGYGVSIWGSRLIILGSALMPSIGSIINIYLYYNLIKGFKERANYDKDIVGDYDFCCKAIIMVSTMMILYYPFNINLSETEVGRIISTILVVVSILAKVFFAVKMKNSERLIQSKELSDEK